jgi:hypothetical protein
MFRKIVYCSPVEGLIHWQGKPVAHAKVERALRSGGFEGGEYKDFTQTGEHGRFQMETVEERRFLRPDLLSANPRVNQSIEILFEGHSYLVWVYSKHDFNLGTEAKQETIRLNCDLSKFEDSPYGRIVRCQHNGNQAL